MIAQTFEAEPLSSDGQRRIRRTLVSAFLDACRTHGPDTPIVTDGDGRVLSYGEIRRAAFALSGAMKT
ncbi:MAG: hypothetical protein WBF53_06550, partial [Litorimonas sp.]